MAKGSQRKLWIITAAVVLVIAAMALACGMYLGNYYRADMDAITAFSTENSVEYKTLDSGDVIVAPEGATKGLLFYPGGKVEHTAYIPLMKACAEKGILCVLVKMPFNLAVLDVNAADGIQQQYPEIESWYIGGHSLGGSMAASYLQKQADNYEGLILLGSYSTADLSGTGLDVLSIYGSEDRVLNLEKYNTYRSNLPGDFTENVIDGGCHAYFGMYGSQDGDGEPGISNTEQIRLTAEAIYQFVGA